MQYMNITCMLGNSSYTYIGLAFLISYIGGPELFCGYDDAVRTFLTKSPTPFCSIFGESFNTKL